MQKVVLAERYVHVPPRDSTMWPSLFKPALPWYLRKHYGIVNFEFAHTSRLRASVDAGHGIVLMPNHCRDEDGFVMGQLSCEIGAWFYYMSSWHVFKASSLNMFLLPRLGGFSVYREGVDRAAVKTAIGILNRARRPLVAFPEGYLGRTNDRLNPLMDGAALIARSAAKLRAQGDPPGRVVIHPVALRYHLAGPLEPGVAGVLAEIEEKLGQPTGINLPLRARLDKIEEAMQEKLEIEQTGRKETGTLAARRSQLIEEILKPLENAWGGHQPGSEPVQSQVRRLRAAILPGLVQGGLTEVECRRRWLQLGQVYVAQQLDNYPPDYLAGQPPPERILETIERLEEDITDRVRPHVPLSVTVSVGEAIVVSPTRFVHGGGDSLLGEVEGQLRAMLGLSGPSGGVPASVAAPH